MAQSTSSPAMLQSKGFLLFHGKTESSPAADFSKDTVKISLQPTPKLLKKTVTPGQLTRTHSIPFHTHSPDRKARPRPEQMLCQRPAVPVQPVSPAALLWGNAGLTRQQRAAARPTPPHLPQAEGSNGNRGSWWPQCIPMRQEGQSKPPGVPQRTRPLSWEFLSSTRSRQPELSVSARF